MSNMIDLVNSSLMVKFGIQNCMKKYREERQGR